MCTQDWKGFDIPHRRLDRLRTALANERTLLAYVRTTLALFVVGGSLIKFFETRSLHTLGWIIGVFGLGTLTWGMYSYRRTRRIIDQIALSEQDAPSDLP